MALTPPNTHCSTCSPQCQTESTLSQFSCHAVKCLGFCYFFDGFYWFCPFKQTLNNFILCYFFALNSLCLPNPFVFPELVLVFPLHLLLLWALCFIPPQESPCISSSSKPHFSNLMCEQTNNSSPNFPNVFTSSVPRHKRVRIHGNTESCREVMQSTAACGTGGLLLEHSRKSHGQVHATSSQLSQFKHHP